MSTGKTLYQKLYDAHVVREEANETPILYIDRHLVHEVTSPQAFDGLRAKNRFSNLARKLLMQHGNSTRSRHRLLPLHCIFHADKELRQKQIIHASPKMQCHPHQKNQSISLIF